MTRTPGHASAPRLPPGVYVLAGPTATGKTAIAHHLAQECDARILSVDALHAYRGMDIGTAKPSPADRRRFGYAGVDYLDPEVANTAGAFRAHALAALRADPDRVWIAVGGSGLYFHALLCGLPEDSRAADPSIRAQVQAAYDRDGLDRVQAWLREVAPRRWESLADPRNPRRVMRALELALAGATVPTVSERVRPDLVAVDLEPGRLRVRIRERARAMFDGGLVDEARALMSAHTDASAAARRAIGYAEAAEVLTGALTRDEAIERTAARTAHYARRQRTWLRNQGRTEWIHIGADDSLGTVARAVLDAWRRHGTFRITP